MPEQLKLIDDAATSVATRRELRFTVFGLAQTAGSKRAFKHPRTDRIIVTDDNPKSRDWKQAVASAAMAQVGVEWELLTEPLAVLFTFVRPRPKGHFGAKGVRESAPRYPITKPDLLKLARAAEDALTGVVWRDDAQIVDEVLAKRYGEPARLEIVVRVCA